MADVECEIPEYREIHYNGIKQWKIMRFSSFGTVFKAKWNNAAVIVREMQIHKNKDHFIKELNELKRLKHPNIVSTYGTCTNLPDVVLLTEYVAGCSLHDIIHSEPKRYYAKSQAITWSLQCAEGVSYLHSNKILHKDLKPRNLLLTSDTKTLKICDFGAIAATKYLLNNIEGNATYMAPELFMNGAYTEKCDVYSLGITMWELFAREKPYTDVETRIAIPYLVAIKGKRPRSLKDCPEGVVDLIHRCWHEKPAYRPSMEEVAKELSKFCNSFCQLEEPFDENMCISEGKNKVISIRSEKMKLKIKRSKNEVPSSNVADKSEKKFKFHSYWLRSSISLKPYETKPQVSITDSRDNINISDIQDQQLIKWTHFGRVSKGMFNNRPVIIKKLFNSTENLKEEIKVLRNAKGHPNIVQLIGISVNTLVIEYPENGTLHNFIYNESKKYTLTNVTSWLQQCAQGLLFLHGNKPPVLHRDLKPENLFLFSNFNVLKVGEWKMNDYWDLIILRYKKEKPPLWIAPELFGGTTYTEKCDIYSWAVIGYQLLGLLPFAECEDKPHLTEISIEDVRSIFPANCPEPLQKLITNSLDTNPLNRPSISDILETIIPFVSGECCKSDHLQESNQKEVSKKEFQNIQ